MSDPGYIAARYEDLPPKWDGFARLVRHGLGISAFGVNLMNIPPNYETKSHDESSSGQEELYVGLAGSGWVIVNGDTKLELDDGCCVFVEPHVPRTLAGGPRGLRVLIVGGTPGQVYEPMEWSSES